MRGRVACVCCTPMCWNFRRRHTSRARCHLSLSNSRLGGRVSVPGSLCTVGGSTTGWCDQWPPAPWWLITLADTASLHWSCACMPAGLGRREAARCVSSTLRKQHAASLTSRLMGEQQAVRSGCCRVLTTRSLACCRVLRPMAAPASLAQESAPTRATEATELTQTFPNVLKPPETSSALTRGA